MTKARDIMTANPDFLDGQTTVLEAAKRLATDGIGALPVCEADQLRGMITDRDIVLQVVAEGKDPATTRVIDLVRGEAITIGADDSAEEALRTMAEHQVRRLPVLDGTELVGIVSQADVARSLPAEKVGEALHAISR